MLSKQQQEVTLLPQKHGNKKIDIELLLKTLKMCDEQISPVNNGKEAFVVVILGPTKAGKTSLCQILSKYENLTVENENDRIKLVSPSIGDNIESKTDEPRLYTFILRSREDPNKIIGTIHLYDTPGYEDSRDDLMQIIGNGYWIHKLFCVNKKVKILFTLRYTQLDGQAYEAIKSVTSLVSTFENITNIQQKIGYIFTGVEKDKTARNIQGQIQKEILSVNNNIQNLTPGVKNVFQQMVNSQSLLLVRRPVKQADNAEEVFEQYKELYQEFATFLDTVEIIDKPQTKIVISANNRDVLQQIVPDLQIQVQTSLINLKNELYQIYKNNLEDIKDQYQYDKVELIKNLIEKYNYFFEDVFAKMMAIQSLNEFEAVFQNIDMKLDNFKEVKGYLDRIDYFHQIEQLQDIVYRDMCLEIYFNIFQNTDITINWLQNQEREGILKLINNMLEDLQGRALNKLIEQIFQNDLNIVQFIGICNGLTNPTSYQSLIQNFIEHFYETYYIQEVIEIQSLLKLFGGVSESTDILFRNFVDTIESLKRDLINVVNNRDLKYINNQLLPDDFQQQYPDNKFLQVYVNQSPAIENLENQYRNLQTQNQILKNQIGTLQTIKDVKDDTINQFQEKMNQKDKKLEKKGQEILQLQYQLNQSQKQYNAINQKLSDAKKGKISQQFSKRKLLSQTEVDMLQGLIAYEKEQQLLNDSNKKLVQKVEELEFQLGLMGEMHDQAQEQQQQIEILNESQGYNQQDNNQNALVQQLRLKLQESEQQIELDQQQINQLEQKNEKLKQKSKQVVEKLQLDNLKLEQALKGKQDSVDSLETQCSNNSKLKEALDKKENQIQSLQKQIYRLECDVRKFKKRVCCCFYCFWR